MDAIMKQTNNTHFSPPLQFHELVPDLLPLRNLVEQLLVVVQILLHLKERYEDMMQSRKLFIILLIKMNIKQHYHANLGGLCLVSFEQLLCEVNAV